MTILYVPFVLQGIAMVFDEFYYHRQRGLPIWERVGHPLDTLSVLACYLFLFLNPFTEGNLNIYIALGAISCLLITKDEFVHTSHCLPAENWLHAVLFVLHPLAFTGAGFIWYLNLNQNFLGVQSLVIFLFMMYQILYWSFFGKSKQRHL